MLRESFLSAFASVPPHAVYERGKLLGAQVSSDALEPSFDAAPVRAGLGGGDGVWSHGENEGRGRD